MKETLYIKLDSGPSTDYDFVFSDKLHSEIWIEYYENKLCCCVEIPNFGFINPDESDTFEYKIPCSHKELIDLIVSLNYDKYSILEYAINMLNIKYECEFKLIDYFCTWYITKYGEDSLNNELNMEEKYREYCEMQNKEKSIYR